MKSENIITLLFSLGFICFGVCISYNNQKLNNNIEELKQHIYYAKKDITYLNDRISLLDCEVNNRFFVGDKAYLEIIDPTQSKLGNIITISYRDFVEVVIERVDINLEHGKCNYFINHLSSDISFEERMTEDQFLNKIR